MCLDTPSSSLEDFFMSCNNKVARFSFFSRAIKPSTLAFIIQPGG